MQDIAQTLLQTENNLPVDIYQIPKLTGYYPVRKQWNLGLYL